MVAEVLRVLEHWVLMSAVAFVLSPTKWPYQTM